MMTNSTHRKQETLIIKTTEPEPVSAAVRQHKGPFSSYCTVVQNVRRAGLHPHREEHQSSPVLTEGPKHSDGPNAA